MRALPRYRSREEVWALRIAAVRNDVLLFDDVQYAPYRIGQAWVDHYRPEPGGYWIRRVDLNELYLPAAAFELAFQVVGYGSRAVI
ncbi:MAG: hypothetical protein AAFY82_00190 [Pseudomonadota bacterium]